ncbi:hypothetical protein PAHAL_1G449900 [Panicum hallii]|uniref:Uncharacterized protein n=1 Tax=Panicum hallii TaxID=206008 RepID=A0A2T8KYE4_9POAL|nr:hypothetical protein PAHAL_1G449900 [Panicum hallii]
MEAEGAAPASNGEAAVRSTGIDASSCHSAVRSKCRSLPTSSSLHSVQRSLSNMHDLSSLLAPAWSTLVYSLLLCFCIICAGLFEYPCFSVAAGGTHSMVSSKEVTSGHESCHGLLAYDKALGASVIRSGGKSHQKLRHGTSNRSLCIFLSLLISQHIVGQLEVVMLSTTVLKVEHCWIFLFLLAASTLCN